jgi:hypothetical protein
MREYHLEVADLTGELPEADASVDLTLCLYSVLSHLPVTSLPKFSAEVARVTSGHFIATVRSVGSTPTISVDSIEKARHFKRDNSRDRCEVELCDGRHGAFPLAGLIADSSGNLYGTTNGGAGSFRGLVRDRANLAFGAVLQCNCNRSAYGSFASRIANNCFSISGETSHVRILQQENSQFPNDWIREYPSLRRLRGRKRETGLHPTGHGSTCSPGR